MTNICMTIEGKDIYAFLNDSAAAGDFISQLPLTLTLEDYSSTEKISNLPKRLATHGAPAGIAAKAGDITYYTPWGNLAIFYRDFHYADALVHLGKIESGIESFKGKKSLKVNIKLAE